MPVPSDISQLSQTAGSNSPAGSESPSLLDDYFRAISAFIAMHRDGAGFTQEATVASGATTDIGAATSFYVQITGTTTITSFGTNYNGPRFVRFAGALTLTHNATTLILPGAANITTAAGDTCVVVPSGNAANGWRVVSYEKAALAPGVATSVSGGGAVSASSVTASGAISGNSVADASGTLRPLIAATAQATTSGTSIAFTSIPSWVNRITLSLNNVSWAAATGWGVQLGTSGGYAASGYVCRSAGFGSGGSVSGGATTNFYFGTISAASDVVNGLITFVRVSGNTWAQSHSLMSDSTTGSCGGGSVTLGGTLDRLQIFSTAAFDSGSANIVYE